MSVFAQVSSGTAMNVVHGLDVQSALAGVYAPDLIARQIASGSPWVAVPDGTVAGATISFSSDGSVLGSINPAAPIDARDPVPAGATLTPEESATLAAALPIIQKLLGGQ